MKPSGAKAYTRRFMDAMSSVLSMIIYTDTMMAMRMFKVILIKETEAL